VLSGLYLIHRAIRTASKDPKINKQGTAGKKRNVTLMIPQKLEIIRRVENGKS
jgi:hypothetical protein